MTAAKALMIVPPQKILESSKSYNQTWTMRNKTKSAFLTLKSLLRVKMAMQFKTKMKIWKRLSKSSTISVTTWKKKFIKVKFKSALKEAAKKPKFLS